jgi:hypothetical protein
VPPVPMPGRDEALANFIRRYFASRGPATLQDFSYWSGLPMKEAKTGAAMLGKDLIQEKIDGQDYFFLPIDSHPKTGLSPTFLMPEYDEYGMSYKNRLALVNPMAAADTYPGLSSVNYQMLVVNGLISGRWRRTPTGKTIAVETHSSPSVAEADRAQIQAAIQRYCSFFETGDGD